MRNFLIISLLLLFTGSHVGHFCIYSFQQYRLRREVKEMLLAGIPDSACHIIQANPSDPSIEWEDRGKEFSFQGDMYDVARIKVIHGKTYIYCIKDDKEKKLLHDYARAIKSQPDNNSPAKGKQLLKFQLTDYFLVVGETTPNLFTGLVFHFTQTGTAIFSTFKEVNAPPPRAAGFTFG